MKYTTERAAAMITGLNDTRHVVWAIGEGSFFFLCFFFFKLKIYYTYRLLSMKYAMERAAMMITVHRLVIL